MKFPFGRIIFPFGMRSGAFDFFGGKMGKEYFRRDFLIEEVSKSGGFQSVSEIFAALSDSTRLKIFWLLCHSKECVIGIASMLGMTTPAVSHHLRVLKEAGLVEGSRDGKEVFYTASGGPECGILHSMTERLMSVACPDFGGGHERVNERSGYMEDHVEKIKRIHEFLTGNLSERVTIDGLSRMFAMNPTTLKSVFKDVYGESLAAHMKVHRMERAAELLSTTDMSVGEVARSVGYGSQSKFSAVFGELYGVSPREYRAEGGRRR